MIGEKVSIDLSKQLTFCQTEKPISPNRLYVLTERIQLAEILLALSEHKPIPDGVSLAHVSQESMLWIARRLAGNDTIANLREVLEQTKANRDSEMQYKLTTSEQIRKAKENGRWEVMPDIKPIPPGHIRLFRGVKPEAISTEFQPELNEADRAEYNAFINKMG